MRQEPRLPSVYRLITVSHGEEVAETARHLAQGGADDGTLVWAAPAETGGAPEDFTCALILQPECPLPTALQLLYVGALGLNEALGSLLPPATELVFEWPGTLVLSGGRIGEVRLEAAADGAGQDGNVDWVVLWASIRFTRRSPEELVQFTSLCDEGCEHIAAQELLESFARYFLNWANRWLDDGFAPVRTAWLARTSSVGQGVSVAASGAEDVSGTFLDVDDEGRLVLEVDGKRRSVALSPAFSP